MDRVIDFTLQPVASYKTTGDQYAETQKAPRTVTGTRGPITRAEFTSAGLLGITPSLTVTLACADDYEGEPYAIIDGERFHVYRTYETESGGIELYLEKRAGDRPTRIQR